MRWTRLGLIVAAALASTPAVSQTWPERNVTIVVPFGDVDFELEGVAVGLVRNTMLM